MKPNTPYTITVTPARAIYPVMLPLNPHLTGHRVLRTILLFLLLVGLGLFLTSTPLNGQSNPPASVTLLSAPPPPPVAGVSASNLGNSGNNSYCWWVVPTYPIGDGPVNQTPACLNQINGPSASNTVRITWPATPSATSYRVLRATSPNLPITAGVCLACSVTTTTGTTYTDTGAAGSNYSPTAGSGVQYALSLDALGSAVPLVKSQLGGTTYTLPQLAGTPTTGNCVSFGGPGVIQDSGGTCGATTGTVTTDAAAFTSGLPIVGAGGVTPKITTGTKTGNTSRFATASGTLNSNNCAKWDASGNAVDAGAPCGTGAAASAGNYLTVNGTDYFGGDLFAVTRPTAAGSFAWVNQGTTTLDTSTGAFSFLFPKTSGNSVRMYLQSTPTPPYTYKFLLKSFQIFANNQYCGVGWRESGTDKISAVNFGRGDLLRVTRWANQTAAPSNTFSNTVYSLGGAAWWLTLSRSGSTLTYSIGVDAVTRFTLVSEAMTGPFTTAPDQIGIVCDNDSGNNWDNLLTVFAINIS